MARQLYYRALAGDSSEQLNLTSVPTAVKGRLAELELDWNVLDGIAQRALLWDTGFGFTTSNKPIQIFPDGSHSMDNLILSLDEFEEARCVTRHCSQPESYSYVSCEQDQVVWSIRCLIQDFEDDIEDASFVWTTGISESPDLIPSPHVMKYAWWPSDGQTLTYLLIHTQTPSKEPNDDECPTSGDYSSVVIPCASMAKVADLPGDNITVVTTGSRWVSRWLAENYTKTSTPTTPAPVNDTSATTAKQATLGPAAIIGIVATCTVVVFTVIGFILARRRRTEVNQGQTGLWNDDIITANRIPREKVRIVNLISRGAYGEVYTGLFHDHQVAVKMLLPSTRRDIRLVNDFLAEAKLTASMEHPRIAACIGIAWDSLSDLCVVLEFMEGGDLRTLLDSYKKSNHPEGFDREKVTIALHVAHALTYLHSLDPPVIHRDLKSRNILLNEMHEAKLTDFGVSRERLDRTMTAGVGTSLWMAPEVMIGEKYDDKADIFSFGVVLSELDTHTLPYAQARQEMQNSHGRQMTDATLLQRVAMGTVTVEFSEAGPKSIADLGYACVSVDPTMRPSAAEALFKLQVILSKELA
ncbi:hypothetical protein Pcac1_g18519 [Phytophthora cactorum]|uniref:Protein kinase domain-containing protein n=2 Tax=Phytophthora cactorum TaxID=29920 RepID=A0A329SYD1_9STRA|nr:hypothetical protein Pcac1_g18519 [Phytophthora cactorum]KAG2837616.1 hypothetical protein PC111_g4548 [Phytophthora cactorum]KAG3024362.1 hypothetical protein PC119_g8514 [Phytophthora cactorum]RAW41595.1 hypothetical protein PC110_g2231 [Phytophthora cactorum]